MWGDIRYVLARLARLCDVRVMEEAGVENLESKVKTMDLKKCVCLCLHLSLTNCEFFSKSLPCSFVVQTSRYHISDTSNTVNT